MIPFDRPIRSASSGFSHCLDRLHPVGAAFKRTGEERRENDTRAKDANYWSRAAGSRRLRLS